MRAKFYFILIFNFIFDVYIFFGGGGGLAPLCYFCIFLDIEHTMAQQALLRYMYTDEKLHVSPLLPALQHCFSPFEEDENRMVKDSCDNS